MVTTEPYCNYSTTFGWTGRTVIACWNSTWDNPNSCDYNYDYREKDLTQIQREHARGRSEKENALLKRFNTRWTQAGLKAVRELHEKSVRNVSSMPWFIVRIDRRIPCWEL
jgi:hypothetical protein